MLVASGMLSGRGQSSPILPSTLDEGHSVAAVTLDYQSLGGLSTQTLLSATAAMPPSSPESNDVHDLRTIQAYAISYAYGVTNDFTVAVRLPYVRRNWHWRSHQQDNGDLEVENFGTADGIGDLTLFGQYRFFRQNKTEIGRFCSSQDTDGSHQQSHGARPTVRCRVSTRLRLVGPSLRVGVDTP